MKYKKKIGFCVFWAFDYHHRSVLTFISSPSHSVMLATMDPPCDPSWPIMSFLHQDLILYNWTPANLPVTIIFSHSSDLLIIFTVHAVQSWI